MIIIPTYNERKNISLLVGRIRAVERKIPILFVDDSSPDGTAEEIKSLQQNDPNILLLQRPQKSGFASAYLEGFQKVLSEFKPNIVIIMDADLSHPPEKLPELIAAANSGKVAVGSRYVKTGGVKNWDLRRRILSRLGNIYARLLAMLPLKDATGGFMAIPTEFITKLDLDTIQSRGYAFLMEIKVRLNDLNAEFTEVPIIFEERKEGESKLSRAIVLEAIKYPAKVFFERQKKHNRFAWLLFIISSIVYVASLPKTMYLGDSPEYITSAVSMGIPHPSGNPAYVLIAHIFSWLPFSPAFSTGLFSALSASIGLVVFYIILSRLGNKFVALAVSLILAFSDIFWSQAVMVKVYAPMFMLLMLIFYFLMKYFEQGKNSYLYGAMFLFGLGIGIHQSIVLFAPLLLIVFAAFCYRLWQTEELRNHKFKFKPFFVCLFLLLLGLSTYAYLPLRSNMDPSYSFAKLYNFSHPGESISAFANYVLRSEYDDFARSFNWQDKQIFLSSFLYYLWRQFPYLLFLAVPGVVYLGLRSRKIFLFSSTIFLLNLLGIIFLRSADWNQENGFLYSFYYLPNYAMGALWIGAGFVALFRLFPKQYAQIYLPALLFIFPVILLNINGKSNYLSDFDFSRNYVNQILESLPQNSILLISISGAAVDTVVFGLQFEQIINKTRPDITILNSSNIHPDVDRKAVAMVYGLDRPQNARLHLTRYAAKIYPGRPIFTTYLADNLVEGMVSRSNGLVYALVEEGKTVAVDTMQVDYFKDLPALESNMFGQDLLSQYFYAQGAACAAARNLHCTQEYFILAIKYDTEVGSLDQQSFMSHRSNFFQPQ